MAKNIDQYADIIDVRDIIERIDELEEQQTPRYVAGTNMPGYMPDDGPSEFESFEDAQRFILADIKRDEEQAETEEQAEELAAFAEDVNLESAPFSGRCGNRVYWVTLDGTMGLDDEESEELAALLSLMDDLKGNGGDEQWRGDWYPLTLIRYSHFRDYAQELAEDIGALPSDAQWPTNCIDWDQAARELRMDYTSVEFHDVTYWTR